MNKKQFSLIIPLWNEEKNITSLVEMIASSPLIKSGALSEVLLIDNGSDDKTKEFLKELAEKHSWISPLYLAKNINYGGGVYYGITQSTSEIVAYIPGDLQVQMDDVEKVWNTFQKNLNSNNLFVKGYRTIRKDGFQTRFVSKIYTFLANILIGIKIKDVNGLPKMFSKSLIDLLAIKKMETFVFDAQLIYTARKNNWLILEVPVTFHARRTGVSSWSKKRLNTYWVSFKQMASIPHLKYQNDK